MGRECMSIETELKKSDNGLKIRNKESFKSMIRMEHLFVERFIRMTKKSSVKKLKSRFNTKAKKDKETTEIMNKT